jgi:hypothetical protein
MRGTWLVNRVTRLALRLAESPGQRACAYARLERTLSSPSWRTLSELVAWRQRQRARRKQRRARPALAATSAGLSPEAPPATLLARAPSLEAKLKLLDEIFVAGGNETAAQLASELEQQVAGAPERLRTLALPLFTRIWMTAGVPQRAAQAWETLGADSSAEHPLRQALLLELKQVNTPRWHSAHGFHPYLADASIQRGRLEQEQLAAYLLDHPWWIMSNPELELVLHNARNRPANGHDLSAFNRYLRRHGLEPARKRSQSDVWLRDLSFADQPTSRAGPLVSVIMSARNAAHTIGYAIDSILCQTHTRFELLVADDGSDDGTSELLRERYAADPRVRLFRSERNQGTYNVRNLLIEQARGELITFQDADDLALPTRLARQVQAVARTGAVGSVGEWLRIRADGSVAFFWNGRAARLSIVSLMASRAALRGLGGYPPARVGADLDVYRRLLKRHGASSVVRLATPLLLGLWSEQSLTRSALSESLESGYRSPVRRRYSELVFRRDLFGLDSLPEPALIEQLRAMGNYLEPSRLLAAASDAPA